MRLYQLDPQFLFLEGNLRISGSLLGGGGHKIVMYMFIQENKGKSKNKMKTSKNLM